MNVAPIITAFSDIHIVIVSIGGMLVLGFQILQYMKQLKTDKTVTSNSRVLHNLSHAVDEDIRNQIEVLKKQNIDIQRTTLHLEELIENRMKDRRQVPQPNNPGRRSGEPNDLHIPDKRRKTPLAAPEIHDPKAAFRSMHDNF